MSNHVEQRWIVAPERRFPFNLADAVPAEEVILTVAMNRPLTENEVLALCPVVDAIEAFAKFLKGPVTEGTPGADE